MILITIQHFVEYMYPTDVPEVDIATTGIAIGDSTVAAYLGGNAVASFLFTGDEIAEGFAVTSIAVPGHTIAQQKTAWSSTAGRSLVDWVIVQVGLNDLLSSETAAIALARYQDLINTIRSDNTNAIIIVSTMIPCRQRAIDLYGSTNGPISYQKWLDMNEAIKGNGSNAITGVEGRISSHTTALNDGAGNLAAAYDLGDHIHENNAGRQIIAAAWREKLIELNLI